MKTNHGRTAWLPLSEGSRHCLRPVVTIGTRATSTVVFFWISVSSVP